MTVRVPLFWSLAAVLSFLPGGRALAAGGSYDAGSIGPSFDSGPTLEEEVGKLKDAVASPVSTDGDVYRQAAAFFGSIPDETSTKIGPAPVRGWEKPDRTTQENVSGMMGRFEDTLARSWSRFNEPPEPELLEAYAYGKGMQEDGKAGYDDDGKVLNDRQLGAYVYTKFGAVGIFFNKAFRKLQQALGDGFAAATWVHESKHAADHAKGELNPVEVKKGEESAFEAEYRYLVKHDPTGQMFSWAANRFCGDPAVRGSLACKYLEHLGKIKQYGSRDDFKGLVDSLGYKDRDHDPFAAPPPSDPEKAPPGA